MTYQEKLGSVYDKVIRQKLAVGFCGQLGRVLWKAGGRAAWLSKADLVALARSTSSPSSEVIGREVRAPRLARIRA